MCLTIVICFVLFVCIMIMYMKGSVVENFDITMFQKRDLESIINVNSLYNNATTILNSIDVTGKNPKIVANSFNNISDDVRDVVPPGLIIVWGGDPKNIPNGWVLCDGSNGTPDLRDKFVFGSTYSGSGGGKFSVKLKQSDLPNHNHTVSYYPKLVNAVLGTGSKNASQIDSNATVNNYDNPNQTSINVTPPFCILSYIMKSDGLDIRDSSVINVVNSSISDTIPNSANVNQQPAQSPGECIGGLDFVTNNIYCKAIKNGIASFI